MQTQQQERHIKRRTVQKMNHLRDNKSGMHNHLGALAARENNTLLSIIVATLAWPTDLI
jgi:polysaccharide deacetylase 2 family uncharacterized protein YibQ